MEWQGEFVYPKPFFHRIDEESLLAEIVFADESMSGSRLSNRICSLTFLAEEGQWRYHDAAISSSATTSSWSSSVVAAEERFAQTCSSGARRALDEDDNQDYWQLYDMELPQDPSAEAASNAMARKMKIPEDVLESSPPILADIHDVFPNSNSPSKSPHSTQHEKPSPMLLLPVSTKPVPGPESISSTVLVEPTSESKRMDNSNQQQVASTRNIPQLSLLERQLERTLDSALVFGEAAGLPSQNIKRVIERLLERYS